jgi:hypothetical protein
MYAKARGDLGQLFDGEMEERIAGLHWGETRAILDIGFAPLGSDDEDVPWRGRERVLLRYIFRNVAVYYRRGSGGFIAVPKDCCEDDRPAFLDPEVGQRFSLELEVWADGHGWDRDCGLPDALQPMMLRPDRDGTPEPCYYPRWNPGGIKYGFFDRCALRASYEAERPPQPDA